MKIAMVQPQNKEVSDVTNNFFLAASTILLTLLTACSQEPAKTTQVAPEPESSAATGNCNNYNENGMALFGDLHVHTSYSFDAAANSTGATPADANRYARGEAIPFFPIGEDGKPAGRAQIDYPLDFLAVTDHGEFLGERRLCRSPDSPAYDTRFCIGTRVSERQGMMMMGQVITTETPTRIAAICEEDGAQCSEFAKSPWQDIQRAANEANTPCEFTSFVAYEYTGTPGTSNYHRNVIFRDENVPSLPVSYIDAPIDSKLWEELNNACKEEDGCDYLTIPHNTNLANGRMAPYMKLPDTVDAKRSYAETRLAREPIMEIFQHKGSSECINGLSSIFGAPDELCGVEAVRRVGQEKTYVTLEMKDGQLITGQASEVTRECEPDETGANGMLGAGCVHATDFQRSALAVGLREEQETGLNPIKLGIIAATDTHSANPGGVAESDWGGAVSGESNPAERLQPGLLTSGIDGNPGGLAGIWAKQNTRDAIFDAMLSREVFGTSGPRITVRLFAGENLPADLCERNDMVDAAYDHGVPMGADLSVSDGKPRVLAWAAKDPNGRDLQELQLIKGWVDGDGGLRTSVQTIASAEEGSGTLCTVFTDETFDASQSAYYYLRAVEPESPRWHTYDCARLDEGERPDICSSGQYPETIREMAWSSPIWYKP